MILRLVIIHFVPMCLFFVGTVIAEDSKPSLHLLPLKSFRPDSSFWSPKLETYSKKYVHHSEKYIQNSLRALRKAAGESVDGDLNGTWDEAVLYKVLESWAESLALFPDSGLEKKYDEIVSLIARAQQPDGYVHAFIINTKIKNDDPEKNVGAWWPGFLDGSHEGYVLGHLLEASIAYYEVTGKTEFLEIAKKAALQAYHHFVRDNTPGFCGHAGLKMGLAELYRIDPDPSYLELLRAWVEWRGRDLVPWADPEPGRDHTPRAYFQDGDVLRNMKTLEGHAVRALFFASGVADYALETGNIDYRLAANRFWDSVAGRRMGITGNVGPRDEHEAFGEDYELPSKGYYESCAACALVDFSQRMFLLEQHREYADVMERTLYNAVLHSVSLDGTTSYYMNPLSDHENMRYNSWVCCPPNIARTLLQLVRYTMAYNEKTAWLNLFVGGEYTIPCGEGQMVLRVETDYPWDGNVDISVLTPLDTPYELCLRIPGWCENTAITLNGRESDEIRKTDNGYYAIKRAWKKGDRISYRMAMPVVRIVPHPNIQDLHGKVALQRGPLVYAFESLDLPGNMPPDRLEFGDDPKFQTKFERNLLGGVIVIECFSAKNEQLRAIPFYALANRTPASQEVWVRQRGLKLDTSWWSGRLYRPLVPHWLEQ